MSNFYRVAEWTDHIVMVLLKSNLDLDLDFDEENTSFQVMMAFTCFENKDQLKQQLQVHLLGCWAIHMWNMIQLARNVFMNDEDEHFYQKILVHPT